MELGLPHDEEVVPLGHVVELDLWKAKMGPDHAFEHTGATMSRVATQMLRHGDAHSPFCYECNDLCYADPAS